MITGGRRYDFRVPATCLALQSRVKVHVRLRLLLLQLPKYLSLLRSPAKLVSKLALESAKATAYSPPQTETGSGFVASKLI